MGLVKNYGSQSSSSAMTSSLIQLKEGLQTLSIFESQEEADEIEDLPTPRTPRVSGSNPTPAPKNRGSLEFDIDRPRNSDLLATQFQTLASGGYKTWKARNLCYQIADGLAFIHKKNIIHRDLTCNNIFLQSQTNLVKILGFDLAIEADPNTGLSKGYRGASIFMPKQGQDFSSYSTKFDIWTLGVVFFVMLTGRYPFSMANRHKGVIDWEDFPDEQMKELISKMLAITDKDRPSIDTVIKNDWFLLPKQQDEAASHVKDEQLTDENMNQVIENLRDIVVAERYSDVSSRASRNSSRAGSMNNLNDLSSSSPFNNQFNCFNGDLSSFTRAFPVMSSDDDE